NRSSLSDSATSKASRGEIATALTFPSGKSVYSLSFPFPFQPSYNLACNPNGSSMKEFCLKRWFLLLLVGAIALAACMPRSLQPVVAILEPKAIVSVALFLMAWCLESHHLRNTLLHPWPAVWAVIISYGLLPALAWLIGFFIDFADFRIGLLMI